MSVDVAKGNVLVTYGIDGVAVFKGNLVVTYGDNQISIYKGNLLVVSDHGTPDATGRRRQMIVT